MAHSDRGLPPGIVARPLHERDLDAALALSQEAGWNQIAADWQIFLELGRAICLTRDDRTNRNRGDPALSAQLRLDQYGTRHRRRTPSRTRAVAAAPLRRRFVVTQARASTRRNTGGPRRLCRTRLSGLLDYAPSGCPHGSGADSGATRGDGARARNRRLAAGDRLRYSGVRGGSQRAATPPRRSSARRRRSSPSALAGSLDSCSAATAAS